MAGILLAASAKSGAVSNGLLTNLISYWKLDESSGNATDAHGSNTLTDNGGVGTASGIINTGRTFDGSNDYLSCADNASLSTGDVDFTLQFWVYPTSLTGFPVVGNKGWQGGSGPNREWVIYLNSGVPTLEVANGGGSTSVAWGSSLSANVWSLIHVWHDAMNNLIGISVNAGTAVTTSYSGGVADGTGDFVIGASVAQSLWWVGRIDEAAFWKNRVLSSTDRTTLYGSGSGLAYLSFN
jgi:hypothetical protein